MDSAILDKLNKCLVKFGAQTVRDITDVYEYYPNPNAAKLGSGSYGEAFRMKSLSNPNEPLRVVKSIIKGRVTKSAIQIQHICVELAVTKLLVHENLNRRVGLYHNSQYLFIVLELCEGKKPDLSTRLYHLFGKYARSRIPDVPQLVARTAEGDEDRCVEMCMREIGVKAEVPQASDLFNAIVLHHRIPPKKSLIILKQILTGLAFLHSNGVVHRDMKTENLVVGEDRRATPILSTEDPTKVIGVRIEETVHCRIIDFGLVKYLNITQFPTSPSPSIFTSTQDIFANAPALVSVTPCGTELYCSLEVIQGILSGGCGRQKWQSTMESLPKFDVYGAGTMAYCMLNGRPPFRFQSYRAVSKEEKLKQIAQKVQLGPQHTSHCPKEHGELVNQLMLNDVSRRPTAAQALLHDLFKGISHKYAYEVYADGRFSDENVQLPPEGEAEQPAKEDDEPTEEEAESSEDAIDALRLLMQVVRGQEDEGDADDKDSEGTETETTTTTAA